MIKSLLLLLSSFLNLACQDVAQTPVPIGVPATTQKPSILWTADWSPDGKYYGVGGDDKLLRLFDAKENKLIHTYTLPAAVQCLDWHPAGKLLAIALDDQPAQVLDIETKTFLPLKGVTGSRALAWNRDGRLLAIGDYDGLLHIYDKNGKQVTSIKKENTKAYLSVDWHPTKDSLLTGSDMIRLFDLSGKMLQRIKHREEATIILTVKWHPGGLFFAIGDYGHNDEGIESLLQYWKEDGTLIKSLRGSNAEYRNIRWNKNGTVLATASDGLRLWSKEGELLYKGETTDLLWGIDWNSQSRRIITSSEKGSVILWNDQAGIERTIL